MEKRQSPASASEQQNRASALGSREADMSFVDQLWQRGQPLLSRMMEHPFNCELAAGSLDRATFVHYLQQDEYYIQDYIRALELLAERTADDSLRHDLTQYATEGLELEQAMQREFFSRYQIESAAVRTLACSEYGGFLLDQARNAAQPVALAALLPCFWFYWEVGRQLLRTTVSGNPYQSWIATYSGDEFRDQVATLLDHVEYQAGLTSPEERKLMIDGFITSALLELTFWETIYFCHCSGRGSGDASTKDRINPSMGLSCRHPGARRPSTL